MKITEVRVSKVETEGPLKAFVSVTLDGVFAVHGLRVVEGKNGVFVSMPNRKDNKGEFKDVAHPVDKAFRDELVTAVLDEFNK